MRLLRQNLPWRSFITDCDIFSSYFSCFGLIVDTSWFKINDRSRPLPQMPLAPSTPMLRVHTRYQVFVIILILMNRRWGLHHPFFFQDQGVALVAKTCPHRPQAIEKTKNGQTFPLEKIFFFYLWKRRLQVLQGMPVTFHANMGIRDLPMFNI